MVSMKKIIEMNRKSAGVFSKEDTSLFTLRTERMFGTMDGGTKFSGHNRKGRQIRWHTHMKQSLFHLLHGYPDSLNCI